MITLDVNPPTANRWGQPFVDLIGPQRPSDWLRQVAHMRVFSFDRIRQFLALLALVALIAGSFTLLPSVSWWAWALLGSAVVQGVLEIALEPYMRFNDKRNEPLVVQALEPLRTWWIAAYGKLPFNPTGVLGAFAVISNLVAVAFGTTADDATARPGGTYQTPFSTRSGGTDKWGASPSLMTSTRVPPAPT